MAVPLLEVGGFESEPDHSTEFSATADVARRSTARRPVKKIDSPGVDLHNEPH